MVADLQRIHTARKRLPECPPFWVTLTTLYADHSGHRCPPTEEELKKTNLVTRYALSGVAHGTAGVRSVGREYYTIDVFVVDGFCGVGRGE
jgi:hypothetical protein